MKSNASTDDLITIVHYAVSVDDYNDLMRIVKCAKALTDYMCIYAKGSPAAIAFGNLKKALQLYKKGYALRRRET